MERMEASTSRISDDMHSMSHNFGEMNENVKEIRRMSEAHFKMLSTFMKGVEAPKIICFLPAVEHKAPGRVRSWLQKLQRPSDWFNERVRIFFIDPFTLTLAKTNDGNGFELDYLKEWAAKAMPYVKISLTVLKVAVVAGKLGGFPIPDIEAIAGEWVDTQLAAFEELKSQFEQEKDEDVLNELEEQCKEMFQEEIIGALPVNRKSKSLGENLKEPLKKSVEELDKLLEIKYPKWRDSCGLVKAVAPDGTCEWVLPEHKEKFEKSALYFEDCVGDMLCGVSQ